MVNYHFSPPFGRICFGLVHLFQASKSRKSKDPNDLTKTAVDD